MEIKYLQIEEKSIYYNIEFIDDNLNSLNWDIWDESDEHFVIRHYYEKTDIISGDVRMKIDEISVDFNLVVNERGEEGVSLIKTDKYLEVTIYIDFYREIVDADPYYLEKHIEIV